MSGLFSRKSKSIPEPPLPDELPLNDNPRPKSNPDFASMPPPPMPDSRGNISTHDMIPNDIQIGSSGSASMIPPPLPDDFSPGNLPSMEDGQQLPEPPSDALFAQNIPDNVESRQLPQIPELPEVRDANITRKPLPAMQAPAPIQGDEEIPAPPAIFSDEHFYDTPQEIRHLVREEREEQSDLASKYNLNDMNQESAFNNDEDDTDEKEIIQIKTKGPLFVDIESFRVMLSDIDQIKNNIKTSSQIMEHMTEIKGSKDREFERWRNLLEDMQRKINYVDKLLLKGA